jgi:SH3-like domain-containing protein
LIVGAKSGWLKIDTGNGQFGWVFGTLLGTHTTWNQDKTTPLYAEPNANSRVTTVLREFEMRAYIIYCTGQWAYVEVRPEKGPAVRGWLAPQNQCAEPYTTCG